MRKKAVPFQLLEYGSHRSGFPRPAWSMRRGSSAGHAYRQSHITLVQIKKRKISIKMYSFQNF